MLSQYPMDFKRLSYCPHCALIDPVVRKEERRRLKARAIKAELKTATLAGLLDL
jgi:hypothetical protein